MCRLLETICFIDGDAALLPYHQVRFDAARRHFWGVLPPLLLEEVLVVPPDFRQGKVKCRLTYSASDCIVEWEHYTPRRIGSLQLVSGDHLDYAFKYADRSALHKLWQQRGPADDILIVKNGLITDTSYSNVALFDGKRYFTPAQPLLAGVRRAALLDAGLLAPADIRPADLTDFQHIALINGMLDLGECVVALGGGYFSCRVLEM